MIIRKKNINRPKSSTPSASNGNVTTSKNIIKKEEAILDVENVENTNNAKPEKKEIDAVSLEEDFEKIDITSIDFKERVERRRGDRRKSYRRIDERSLVSRAQQEAHNIKELAAREGYQQGLNKAQEEIDEIKNSLIEFLSMKDSMYEEFFPHIKELALEIAKKIIKQEVTMSDEILKNVIISALDEVNSDTQKITLRVNPDDVEFATVSLPEIIETKSAGVKFSITGDESVDKGSCIIVANNGVIDANFKTQLAVLQSAFGIYKGGL